MPTWVTHLAIADGVIKRLPYLCRREFCVGNIAPDCNIENEDWTSFTPPREVTHWMSGERKTGSDAERFLGAYVKNKPLAPNEESFLLGYYAHLITDAGFASFIRGKERLAECFGRIKANAELCALLQGAEENWDTVKKLISKEDRMRDIYSLERKYLDGNPDSGYFTEIIPLSSFPDYIDYLPKDAVMRKIEVMGYIPRREAGKYPYIAISEAEYHGFIADMTDKITDAIGKYVAVRESNQ